ncbi:MAG: HEAT repeat domain-containing protein [Treponema sp.]|nr:HEAT repeat domain-containing protein [Treponema sp.]
MFSLKRFIIFTTILVISASAVFAQMTVEQSYLRSQIELMIIRESARSSTREQKQLALDYIHEVLARDGTNTNDEIRQTLDYLAREGRGSVIRENNRIINNFPDIRRQAARYLGQLKTEEARKTLLDILQNDNEPLVLQEAIKSLGDIGRNDNEETVNHITWVLQRFDMLNPNDLIAISAIDAFEKIAERNNGITSPEAPRILIRIMEGRYVTPVKERARQLLTKLRNYGG